jgi:hypothetical protein
VLINGETRAPQRRLIGMARLLALLFLAAPALASEVIVHLDLSNSIRAGLAGGKVRAIRVELGAPHRDAHIAETKKPVAVLGDVDGGSWTLRTFVLTRDATYIVDPRGLQVEVVPGIRNDVAAPVPALLMSGTVSLHGKPFHGRMLAMPWKPTRPSWTLVVPLDEQGRFAVPLPWAGEWTLQLYRGLGGKPDAVGRYTFKESDVQRSVAIELDGAR